MMRHIALHQPRRAVRTGAHIIRGFKESVFAVPAERIHRAHIFSDLIRRNRRGKQRRVRRDHVVRARHSKRQCAQSERAILVIQHRVERGIAGFEKRPMVCPSALPARAECRSPRARIRRALNFPAREKRFQASDIQTSFRSRKDTQIACPTQFPRARALPNDFPAHRRA